MTFLNIFHLQAFTDQNGELFPMLDDDDQDVAEEQNLILGNYDSKEMKDFDVPDTTTMLATKNKAEPPPPPPPLQNDIIAKSTPKARKSSSGGGSKPGKSHRIVINLDDKNRFTDEVTV